LRDSLSLALGDPGLQFGTWSSTDQRFVQPDGSTLRPPRSTDQGKIWVPVTRDRQQVAAFVADEALATESRLLDAAASAALVSMSDEQIAEDAMALRAEVVSATDSERQRIARDMHDSAQQRLVALRVQVGLATEQLEGQPEEQALMHRLGGELDYAIEEIRAVARRFLGPLVVRNGLGPALRSITRVWPLTVHVDDRGLSRHNPTSELTVYNLCVEALQNSLEHGGQDVTAHVRIKDADNGIWFSITDDGVGFDPEATRAGPGLAGMTDRALLAGGTVAVRAQIGKGVTVSGKIPDPPARAISQ
jgi:signal transduction histidine kinase